MVDAAPLPLRDGSIPLRHLIDLYMAQYGGRDPAVPYRLGWWAARLGDVALADLSDDQVHVALDELATRQPRYFAGFDADGRRIYRAKGRKVAPATINRYSASLSSVISWAIKRRIAPKGYVHPCRGVERRPENNERTRFLSDDEVQRLLQACRGSRWPRLYALVLLAVTTGARRGELLGLRWRDVDLDRGEAAVSVTKNGDPRMLPLVPAVVAELRPFVAGASSLVFPAARSQTRAFAIEPRFKEALRAAGLRGVTFHTLRHSCASLLARNGATLLEIADLLGHRQLQMTKRYSHLATGHKAALVQRVMGGVA